jgi:hypothetical protein
VNYPCCSLKVETFGGDVTDNQMLGTESVPARAPEPIQDIATGNPRATDSGIRSGAPGDPEFRESMPQIMNCVAPGGKHQGRYAVIQPFSESGDFAVSFPRRRFEPSDRRLHLGQIIYRELDFSVRSRKQFPPDQLVGQASGKPPQFLAIHLPSSLEGITGMEQEFPVTSEGSMQCCRA